MALIGRLQRWLSRAIAGACIAAAMLASLAQAQPPAQAPFPWIDVHMHLVAGRGQRQDFDGALDAALVEMDRFGIATAIILPPPQVDEQDWYDAPAYATVLKRHGKRFSWMGGGGELNAMLHRHANPASVTDAVRKEFAAAAEKLVDNGAVGFGEIASLHLSAMSGHPYEFVPADHPLLLVLADVAARRAVPIELHMDAVDGEMPTPPRFPMPPNPPRLPDTIAALGRLLAYNPKATIIWAHAGSDPLVAHSASTLGRLMDAHPNLHASLRIFGPQAPLRNKPLVQGGLDPEWSALLSRHADRFMVGTDSFFVSPWIRGGPGATFGERNVPKLTATIHLLSLLPPQIGAKIGRENAMRLFRIPSP